MPSLAKPQIISSLQHMGVFHWLPWGLLCVLGRGSSCLPREEVWTWGPAWPPLAPRALTANQTLQGRGSSYLVQGQGLSGWDPQQRSRWRLFPTPDLHPGGR